MKKMNLQTLLSPHIIMMLLYMIPFTTSLSLNSGTSSSHLQNLCYASSLSYLPTTSDIKSSPYQQQVPHLTPLAQIIEPITESGATIFSNDIDDDNKDTLIIACRGSATPKNFITNLRFKLIPLTKLHPPANAHEGFQEAAFGLWQRLAPELQNMGVDNKRRLVFTGHSLGGGTAELLSLHAAKAGWLIDELVTFGGPQIGDETFARYVNEDALLGVPIRHVVHGLDPILSNNGPLWDKLGFRRSGVEVGCDPYTPQIFGDDGDDEENGFSIPPWNILDHCKYMGVYVGPRFL